LRRLARIILGLGLAYAAVCAGFLVFRHELIYPRIDDGRGIEVLPGAILRTLPAPGPPVEVWVVPPAAGQPVILHFMGNAGDLSIGAARLSTFTAAGHGLAMMAYRGRAGNPGDPSEDALTGDAVRLWSALDDLVGQVVPTERRVIHGSSLGAALAVALAARTEGEKAVILEAPFTRLCAEAEAAYPLLPACLLMWDEHWDTLSRIGAIGAPLLVQHGVRDEIIPFALGREVWTAAAEPKRLVAYDAAHHNDLGLHGAVTDAVAFLATLD
jgi:fermentation-respiration switch protein FrsA (DUF1100 family)